MPAAPLAPEPAHPAAPAPTATALPPVRPWGGLALLRILARLAWRNVWRNRVRSLLTAGAMVAGLTLMIAYLALMEGMFGQMVGFATDISIGHIQVHRSAFVENQELYARVPTALLEHLERTTPYRYAPRLYAAGLAAAGDASTGALLRGIDPQREPRVTDLDRRLRRGAFDLDTVEQARPYGPDGPPVPVYPVVVGYQLARNLGLAVGGELVLITQAADGSIGNGLFRVRGILQAMDPIFDRMGVFLSLAAFESLMFLPGGAHELAVRADDVAALSAAREEIIAQATACACVPMDGAQAPPGVDPVQAIGGPLRVRTWMEINPPLHDMLASSQSMAYVMAVIVFSIAAMGILNTLLMATYERRHELAILLALGMGRGAMVGMVLLEAWFLGLLASATGVLTGGGLAAWLQIYGFDYSYWLPDGMDFMGVILDPVLFGNLLPQHVAISVAMTLVTALAAALLPSWRTARLRPAVTLHH